MYAIRSYYAAALGHFKGFAARIAGFEQQHHAAHGLAGRYPVTTVGIGDISIDRQLVTGNLSFQLERQRGFELGFGAPVKMMRTDVFRRPEGAPHVARIAVDNIISYNFV